MQLAIALTLLALPCATHAASQTWTGGNATSGNWSTVGDWNGGAAPGSTSVTNNTDTATFNAAIANTWGATPGNPVVIDSTTQNIKSITFDTSAGSYFIGSTGGNSLRLTGSGIILLAATASGTNLTETINAPINLYGSYTFTNARADAGSSLVFGGSITNAATSTLTLSGAGTGTGNLISGNITDGTGVQSLTITTTAGKWALSGTNNYSGLTAITGGGGTTVMQGSNSSNGATTLNSATAILQLDGASNGGLASGLLTLTAGKLEALSTGRTLSNAISLTAVTVQGSQNLTLNGTMTGLTGGARTLTNNIGSGNLLTLGDVIINSEVAIARNLTIAGTGNTTISGIISSGGNSTNGLAITNTGITTLSNANTYTGTTTVSAGTLSLAHTGGTIADSGNVTVSGGTLDVAQSDTVGVVTLSSGTISGVGTLTGTSYSVTSGTISVILGGSGALAKTNSGTTVTLSGNSTYSGGTTAAGTLILGHKNALGTGTFNFSNTLQASIDLSAGNAIGNNVLLTGASTISGSNNITIGGNFTNSGGTNQLINNLNPGKELVLAGNIFMSEASGTGRTLWIGGTGNTTVSGVIANYNGAGTAGTLTITSTGLTTISAANTYTGQTKIGAISGVNAGTLKLSGSGTISNAITTVYGGTLDLNDTTQTITTLYLGGGAFSSTANVLIGAGVLNLGGTVTYTETNNPNGGTISGIGGGVINLNGNRSFTVGDSTAAAVDLVVSAIIADGTGGSNGVTKVGNGTMALSGLNTYTGITSINAGLVSVSNIGNGGVAGNLGAATNIESNINLAGTLQYTGGTASTDRLFRLGTSGATLDASGTGAITFSNTGPLGNSGSGGRTFTLTGNNTANNTLAAVIANVNAGNATTMVKSGVGTWVLSGNNTYTGTTTITAGTCVVSVDKGLGNTSSALVNGGTLDVRGATAGSITLGAGAMFSLTSGTIVLDLGTTYDRIVSSGAGAFTITGGTFALNVGGGGFSYGTSYQVFSGFGGTNSVGGLAITGYDSVNYAASLDTGGNLSFIAVPEPSTCVLLIAVGTLFLIIRRRRGINPAS